MISPVNSFEQHVSARILDFLDSRTPWHRALWTVGSVLTLAEVLEAAEAAQARALSERAVKFLANHAQGLIGLDVGIGSVERRRVVQQALNAKPDVEDLHYHVVSTELPNVRGMYLKRWSDALAQPDHGLRPERTARSIVSHLLDLEFSSNFLHRWWKYRLHHQEEVRPLSAIVLEAHTLAQARPRDFEVLVVFESAVDQRAGTPADLMTSQQVSSWLSTNGSDSRGIRQSGGLLIRVSALDSGIAAQRAAELLDRLTSRVALGTKSGFKVHGQVWVGGEQQSYRVDRIRRGVAVRALQREKQVYASGTPNLLDAALELLSHLQISSPSAAVAGGWAAIEALLSEASDRASAADRLAMLVACSYPRAELTVLSYAIEQLGGDLAAQVEMAPSNRDRAVAVMQGLAAFAGEERLGVSEKAALARMRALVASPRRVLADVRDHAAAAFRRLYRQRNLVLHWGKTDAVALRASLRTAAPLSGAGFDRIVHAHYVDRLKPLELTARAQVALATVGSATGPSCVDLLS